VLSLSPSTARTDHKTHEEGTSFARIRTAWPPPSLAPLNPGRAHISCRRPGIPINKDWHHGATNPSTMHATSDAPPATVTWVHRVSPRWTWWVGVIGAVLSVAYLLARGFEIFGPSNSWLLSWFVWLTLLGLVIFILVMFWVVSHIAQPTLVGVRQEGILLGWWSQAPVRWSDVLPPRMSWFGVELRVRRKFGLFGTGRCWLDSTQIRAILGHPACPQWNLSADSRRRLGLDPPSSSP
jgi:hypothetical protein